MVPEETLILLLLILSVGLIVPELFKKLRVPFVTSLILMGSILGPNGINYIQSNEVINFLGFLGMTFIMFMAGLETNLAKLKKIKNKIFVMAAINGFVPFLVGTSITLLFGYPLLPSVLIGVIFISSSIALAVPSLKAAKIFNRNVGQIILSAILVADAASLVLLSMVFQVISPITHLPLPLYYLVLAVSVIVIFAFAPKLTRYMFQRRFSEKTDYEDQLRFVIIMVIGVLAYFSILGVHPILAAFIIGLTLSQTIRHEKLFTKLHTLGYGLFVPIFFFIVGMEMNLSLLLTFDMGEFLMVLIVVGLISSKLASGYIGGRVVKLSGKDSALFGVTSIMQLTTTLAVTYAAASLGILDSLLVTSVIILSIITTILGPVLLKVLLSLQSQNK